ncbi:MAG: SDR family oxidoreductase [Pseudomonadota bacterium]|nr:SDR family oxidoreductase [Pseudomonadota bacterium]
MKIQGNTILVTGGGSGIGRALAQRWHDLGNQVIVAGRRQDALDEAIAGRKDMFAYTLDIDDPSAIEDFASKIVARHPDLNVLVNNAGVMRYEDVTSRRNLKDAEETITTNLLGPIRLTNALINHLLGRGDSAIINVTSGLAFVPWTKSPTYSATKAALHSYTQALRQSLKGRVEVIELAPPAVQTELTPGQSTRDNYLPLDDFADEAIRLWRAQPTPAEINVERVGFLRYAERNQQIDEALEMLGSL